jgi:hypothetical protein
MHPFIRCLLLISSVAAAPAAAPAAGSNNQAAAALEELLAERESPAALQRAIDKARKAGVSEQAIFEARFIFLIDHHDDDAIAALLPEFDKLDAGFKLEHSGIFATREDWQAVGEYLRALGALKRGDRAAFKRHITEAFWLSPQQGGAFAPHIEKLRLDDAMKALKLDFTQEFKTINGEGAQSLKNIMAGSKALLLHFWSPWSDGADDGMPDFTATARALAKHGVAVASMLPEASPKLLEDAAGSIKSIGADPPGAWLADAATDPLHRRLRVRGFPTMVLVAADGTILFNGDPAADALWRALRQIDPKIARPALATP